MTDQNQSAVLAPIEQARLSAELLEVRSQLITGALSPLAQIRASARALEIRDLLSQSKGQAAFDKAKAYFQEQLQGQMVQSVVGPVRLTGKGWRKAKFGMKEDVLKARLVEHIREILESGTASPRRELYKQRTDSLVAFYFIQKDVQLDDVVVTAGVTVGEDAQGNLFYNVAHSAAKGWVAKEGGTLDSAWIKPRFAQGAADGLFDSLRDKPQMHADTVDINLADDDLNITIISVRAAEAANDGAPAPTVTNALATGMQTQKNGSVLVMGDPAALTAYVAANFDASKIKQTTEGIVFTKAQARLAEFVPTTAQTLESGAVVYEHGAMGGGASVNYQGETSGVARDLADLKGTMAREWGPEKFRAAFGEDAGADDVKAYQDEQQAIADRKAQHTADAEDAAAAPERERQKALEQAAADAVELEQILAQREVEQREQFAKTIGAGVSGNLVYQAYLDTLETLPTYEEGNYKFLMWAGSRVAEFEAKVGGRVSRHRAAYEAYLREYADEHLAARVRATRAPAEPPAEPEQEQPPVSGDPASVVPALEIIEYKTKREKILRGIIRTDLTLDQAKTIDPYTWKMNGGYFIREKHLGGDTAHIQAAPTPVVMTAEQQAEAVATVERQAAERAKQALATQVDKLRQVANKAIGDADGSLNADRKTNTSKRASEAGAAIEKASANKAAGQTLNRVADAIEAGAAGVLAKLSSRAQLDELQRIMRRAQYDADSKLAYGEQLSRKGRPFDENDLKFVVYPRAEVWSNRFANAAKTMASKAQAGNSRLIAALTKLGDGPERITLNDTTIALTRKAAAVLKAVKESWDLSDPMEAIARVDRLARMGVTDHASLVAAVQALIPHLVEKAREDPVKKAERAIVGQKVGIDFFPTPAHVAQRMARLAHIREGMRVLEPSAGNGNLADAAKAEGGVVDVIEISDSLRNILTAKGYTVVDHNFDDFKPEQSYPAILMNPPFSNRQDAVHIMRAFGMLASGGTLVAIAGEGVFFGKDQKAVAFREWLDEHEADIEQLEGGTFKDNALLAQTSANARLIVLRK